MEDCRFFWNILGMLGLALPLLVFLDHYSMRKCKTSWFV